MRILSGICAMVVSALVWPQPAHALFLVTPTFDSGPAVASDSGSVDNSAVIMARKACPTGTCSKFGVILRDGNVWRLGTNEQTLGQYDSGPAIVKSLSAVVFCGHQTGAGTPIICGKGTPEIFGTTERSVLFNMSVSPQPVPGGTFPQWMKPALVRNSAGKVFLFGRGMDDQIWWNALPSPLLWSWQGWARVPTDGAGALGDPVATIDANGKIVVCARSASGNIFLSMKPRCITQTSSGDPTTWSQWSSGPDFPKISSSVLTITSSGVALLAVEWDSPSRALASFFQAATWSPHVVIPAGSSFSGIGASGSSSFSNVLVVGRGGDNALWWTTGSTSGWSGSWTQIQAWYSQPTF